MKHTIKRIGILLAIFVAAIAVYFIWSKKNNEHSDTVYAVAEKAALPLIYPETLGRQMNAMHGYRQEMGNATARDLLTILPEDRLLSLHVNTYGSRILAARFEIRSLDLGRLLERTEIAAWDVPAEDCELVLPIQNLLARDTQYLMMVELDTEIYGTIYYYTRILWTDEVIARSMVDLVTDFSSRTFDYNDARELVTYLETNSSEDNSSFGTVTIRSSFSQLTWGKLQMRPVSEPELALKEADGIMGTVTVGYLAERTTEEGVRELYEVEEYFTMKWNEIRTYMMDYSRETNQIFTGDSSVFNGKRIMLGISNDNRVSSKSSANGDFLAFVSNRELWFYQQSERRTVNVFSFNGGDEQDARTNYNQHNVRVLTISDNGDIVFLVYGYMNRGANEGKMGVAGYQYNEADNHVEELFFVPVRESYEMLKGEIEQLTYLNSPGMLYYLLEGSVYGIDLRSKEYMVVADGLVAGGYAISTDGSQLAWQEGAGLYRAELIHWMDLDSGKKSVIQGQEGELLRALGFVGQDLVYGIAKDGDEWISNGRSRGLPLTAIEILNENQKAESRYEKPGHYISNVSVSESRIHLNNIVKIGSGEYSFIEEDTIVCNEPLDEDPLAGIGWYASPDKGKLYFVQLSNEIRSNANIRQTASKRTIYTQSEQLNLNYRPASQQMVFHAYGGGHYLGSSTQFSVALKAAYDQMGIVVDQNHRIVWNRVNRGNIRTLREPVQAAGGLIRHLDEFTDDSLYPDGVLMLDARGCSLNQVLYFVDKGSPVIAYEKNGGYLLINGFDQYNITITNPVTGMTEKMGLNDGMEYFRARGNDFVCALDRK